MYAGMHLWIIDCTFIVSVLYLQVLMTKQTTLREKVI